MSMFGDYKTYKKFVPEYSKWKATRDLAEAKRVQYLKQNPDKINSDDIQRSKSLLRAIDAMDEYSQKRAEDMEVVTQSVLSAAMEVTMIAGMSLFFLLLRTKSFQRILQKYSKNSQQLKMLSTILPIGLGGAIGSVALLPLYAWGAKAEVKASRKGRFEAMRTELNDPKTFAVLNEEQEAKLQSNLELLSKEKEKKNPFKNFKEGWNQIKEMATETKPYLQQRMEFEQKLNEDKKHFDEELTAHEIESAKRNQQLLIKMVEKIDIASQDYAENTELATTTLLTACTALGGLFSLGYDKLAQKMKWKASSIPTLLGFAAMLISTIFAASLQKQASRVGRFKIKQELTKNPEQLVYVSDEKTGEIKDVEIKSEEKPNMFKFLKEAWKNNKEYNKWKKTQGKKEKKLSKAMENIELSEEQLKDAKQLQHNTFKTFNKIDENSQKYAESIEAVGQAIQYPISMLCTMGGLVFGLKHLDAMVLKGGKNNIMLPAIKYTTTMLLANLPAFALNFYVTKEQKKASRVADMLAIKEMQDYREFADYSRFKSSV